MLIPHSLRACSVRNRGQVHGGSGFHPSIQYCTVYITVQYTVLSNTVLYCKLYVDIPLPTRVRCAIVCRFLEAQAHAQAALEGPSEANMRRQHLREAAQAAEAEALGMPGISEEGAGAAMVGASCLWWEQHQKKIREEEKKRKKAHKAKQAH